jgi:DNA-binding HxlR family transcriptional regulator
MPVARRSYEQYCAMARALDIVGERWTLLLVRDLLLGPKRYKDLLDGQPGIGTNMLAARLRQLQDDGLVRQVTLPPPAAAAAYELTATGLALAPMLAELGRWGAGFLGKPGPDDALLARPYLVAIRSARGLADAPACSYELRIGHLAFEARVAGGRCLTREGTATEPDAVLSMDVTTLHAILMEGLSPQSAIEQGLVTGDTEHLERFATTFALHPAS